MTSTAKAWRFTKPGLPAAVLTLDDVPIPTLPPPLPLPKDVPEPEEWLVVKTAYTGLNPGSQMHFNIIPAFARAKTSIPELDFCGTVVDVWTPDGGSDNSSATPARFRPGDEVVGFLPITHSYPTGNGALATHVRVPARYVVPKPSNVALADVAGLMCASCSAVTLVDLSGIKQGSRVLVVGASGGVGTSTVQLARSLVGSAGLVVGVCSGRNVDLVKTLGADEVVDYLQYKDLSRELARRYEAEPFDAVLDCAGIQAVYLRCAKYLKGDTYLACSLHMGSWTLGNFLKGFWQIQLNNFWPVSPWLGGTGKKYKLIAMMDPGLELMEKTAKYVETGAIKVCVDSVWPADDPFKAYEILASGRARGKLLVKWE